MLAPLLLVVSLLGSPVAPASPADPVPVLDEDAEVDVEYELAIDLVDAEIDVDMAVDITYVKPQERDGNLIVRYLMTEWHALVPSSAERIRVTDAEGSLSFTTDPVEQPGIMLLEVDFRRDLSSGDSVTLAVSYSLPSEPPPLDLDATVELILEDQVVVNDAAVAWAFYSDPRADAWTAEFTLPPGFVEPLDDEVWRRREGTRDVVAAGDEFVYDFVVLENDRAMSETVVPFDGQEITVRYWPDDVAWRDGVSAQITDNLPTLIDLTGTAWPARPLVVQQSAQTLGTSYGGWFASSDNRITIGRSISPELVLHELSHVWFQYDNLADRWLIEGLADEFAALATGGSNDEPEPEVSLGEEVAFALDGWVDPPSVDETTTSRLEAERWAYQASWHVTRTTRESIGTDAFTEVTRAILGDARSYPGPDDENSTDTDRPRSWREFLDLASDRGSEDGELAELYAAWVQGEWNDVFEQRSAARLRYMSLQSRAGGAVLPALVRRPMRGWDFDEADEEMGRTEQFLDDVETLNVRLVDRGLSLPVDFDDRFARIVTANDMATYRADIATSGDALIRLVDRLDSLDRWERIGLIGVDIDSTRTAAVDAFTAGDFAVVDAVTTDGNGLLDPAGRRGRTRGALAVTALLVTLLAVAAGFGRWRRDRRHRHDRSPQSDAGPSGPADGATGYSSSSEEITTSQRS